MTIFPDIGTTFLSSQNLRFLYHKELGYADPRNQRKTVEDRHGIASAEATAPRLGEADLTTSSMPDLNTSVDIN